MTTIVSLNHDDRFEPVCGNPRRRNRAMQIAGDAQPLPIVSDPQAIGGVAERFAPPKLIFSAHRRLP
jgi:hypothetical protein